MLGGPANLSSIIGQNRPRDALCSSLQPLPVATFGISHSVTLSLQGLPTPFSELSSSLPISCELPDSSELLYQDGGHHQPPGLCRPPTPPSLWAILNGDDVALVGEGHFSTNCSRRGTKYLLTGKTGTMAGPSSGRCKSLPRMRSGKTQEPR